MSDYHHAKSMTTCPKCESGEDCSTSTFKFKCDNCNMMFP